MGILSAQVHSGSKDTVCSFATDKDTLPYATHQGCCLALVGLPRVSFSLCGKLKVGVIAVPPLYFL